MKKGISVLTFIGLVIGIIFGVYFKELSAQLAFIGSAYITVLKYLIVPVVFTSISTSIYDTKGSKDKIVLKAIIIFILMFVLTFILTSLVVLMLNPAKGFSFDQIEWTGTTTTVTIGSWLINLLPTSINNFVTGGKIFITIILAFVFGYLCQLVSIGENTINVINKIKEYLFLFLKYFMYVSPIAIFSLVSNTIATNGLALIIVGLRYILTAYICGILTIILIMILPVWLKCHISPIEYITKVSRIWLMTVTTRSSSATLPYTIKVCNEQFNVPEQITNIVVPLGCTIHMCGGAVSFALLGLFCSKLYNVDITITKYLLMVVSSVLINMSAPGIPNGGVVIGATYLELLNVPLDFIGFYSSIYFILDMLYTTLNVTGDITANNLIKESLE